MYVHRLLYTLIDILTEGYRLFVVLKLQIWILLFC